MIPEEKAPPEAVLFPVRRKGPERGGKTGPLYGKRRI